MKNPIYIPSGKALEYAEHALNLYNGCPHGCVYCYARCIARKTAEQFREYKYRENLLEVVKRQLSASGYAGKLIHLCFFCDPFPQGANHKTTLEIIELIKEAGAAVQILTKGTPPTELWELLDKGDKFGVTATCLDSGKIEPYAAPVADRLGFIKQAKAADIQTFVSCEPVLDMDFVGALIKYYDEIDEYRIGKLNYNTALERELRAEGYLDKSWGEFGRDVEELCQARGRRYLIKESLLAEIRRQR